MPFVNLRYYLNTYGTAMAYFTILLMAGVLVIQWYTGVLTWVSQLGLILGWFLGGILEYYNKGCPAPPTYKVYTNADGLPGTGIPKGLSPNASVRVD